MNTFNELKLLCIQHSLIVVIVLLMSGLDLITGIIKGIVKKEFSSSKLKKGLLIKPLYIVVLFSTILIQFVFNIPDISVPFFSTTLSLSIVHILSCFFILTEFTSIIENTNEYMNYPKWLINLLSKLNKNFDELTDKEN